MNDVFTRDRLQILTGLTKFTQVTASGIALSNNTWTTIHPSSATALANHLIISAYKISLTGTYTEALFRIVANTVLDDLNDPASKIFPYSDSTEIMSGVDMYLQYHIQIPRNNYYALQVKVNAAGCTASLDYMSIISVLSYSNK